MTRRLRTTRAGSAIFALVLAMSVGVTPARAATITEYPVPTAGAVPVGITTGSDGALWFTENGSNRIGRLTTTGNFAEFPVPSPTQNDSLFGITAGPDGALWFVEQSGNNGNGAIGRMTTAGSLTEYGLTAAGPNAITAGPDGALWFTESSANKIGRITTAGVVTNEYTVPTPSGAPFWITSGPDGALWFTELSAIGRVTTGGSFTEFPVPTATSQPWEIAAGPDGALWFTELAGNRIGRVTTSGSFSEFAVPTPASQPYGITTGPDLALWFAERIGNNIGRVSTGGTITEFPVPTAASFPLEITAGPDGALWFTEAGGNKIGRITPGPSSPSDVATVVGQLLAAGCIDNAGVANALIAKLSAAQSAIAAGDIKTAVNTLTAFINQVQAQRGKHILTSCTLAGVAIDPAAVLIADAQSIIDSLTVSTTPNPITGSVVKSAASPVAGATLGLMDSSGATLATATTDLTGFYYFATTGVLSPGAAYSVTVTGLPAGFASASLPQSFTWAGSSITLNDFVLN